MSRKGVAEQSSVAMAGKERKRGPWREGPPARSTSEQRGQAYAGFGKPAKTKKSVDVWLKMSNLDA